MNIIKMPLFLVASSFWDDTVHVENMGTFWVLKQALEGRLRVSV